MIRFRNVTSACCFVVASALAQTPPPAPPQPPAPPAAVPSPTPMAVPAPAAPGLHRIYLEGLDNIDVHIDTDAIQAQVDAALSHVDFDAINEQAARAAEMVANQEENLQRLRANADMIGENVRRAVGDFGGFAFAQQAPRAPTPPTPPVPAQPMTMFGQNGLRISRNMSVDSLYDRGQRALDNHNFDQALDAFTEVVNRGGVRADAALYWKAYTLNKLGRRDEATAAITELRTKYASSRWLDDAKALEIEVKQSAGQKVTPESQSDDELKLLALNGLVQSDPDRALPILERLLKGAQSPQVKKRAIYVLASNSSPKAQQLLEQIARGAGNPDLQLQAILYIGATKQNNRGQLLAEIYASTTDQAVKRAVLNALASSRDKDHLIQLAKSEKNTDLRLDAIRMVGSTADQSEMWQFYQSETDPAVKAELLRLLGGNTEKLTEVARTDKDAKLRRAAVQGLCSVKAANITDSMVSIYGSEQDPQVKRSIVNCLADQRNVTALVQLGKKESDLDTKKSIVRRLVDMKSPEANQFLEEILNK